MIGMEALRMILTHGDFRSETSGRSRFLGGVMKGWVGSVEEGSSGRGVCVVLALGWRE